MIKIKENLISKERKIKVGDFVKNNLNGEFCKVLQIENRNNSSSLLTLQRKYSCNYREYKNNEKTTIDELWCNIIDIKIIEKEFFAISEKQKNLYKMCEQLSIKINSSQTAKES